MSCRHAKCLMSARLDNDITPEDAERLEEHLDACPYCRRIWQAMCAEGTIIRDDRPSSIRSDFTDLVMSKIQALAAPVFQPPAWREWTAVVTVLSIVFMLIVVPAVSAFLVWRFNPGVLTGIASWYGGLSQSVGYWLSITPDRGLGLIRSVVESLFGGGGRIALGGALVLTGLFMAAYAAIWTRYQNTLTRA